MLNYFEIGMRIRQKRKEFKWSLSELADKLDISVKHCADMELGNCGFSLQVLDKLCNALHVTSDYILFGSSPDEYGDLLRLLQACPEEKRATAEGLLRFYLQSLE